MWREHSMNKRRTTALPDTGAAIEPLPAPRVRLSIILTNIVRQATPLASMYYLHGSVASFLLLTAFNLSLGLMFIVGSTRDRGDVTTVDPRSRWLVMRVLATIVVAAFLAFMAAIIMIPVAMPAFVLGWSAGIEWSPIIKQNSVLIPAAFMALLAAIRYQTLFEQRTTPGAKGQPSRVAPVVGDLERDRTQSLGEYAAQVTLIVTYVAMCFVLIEFRGWGLYAFPPLYVALLIFYDMRPDIAKRILPQLWQRK
jgi:hypothetical protein